MLINSFKHGTIAEWHVSTFMMALLLELALARNGLNKKDVAPGFLGVMGKY